jgi:hypothetical protein
MDFNKCSIEKLKEYKKEIDNLIDIKENTKYPEIIKMVKAARISQSTYVDIKYKITSEWIDDMKHSMLIYLIDDTGGKILIRENSTHYKMILKSIAEKPAFKKLLKFHEYSNNNLKNVDQFIEQVANINDYSIDETQEFFEQILKEAIQD